MSKNEQKKTLEGECDFLCSNKLIISVKEARKILGKNADIFSDEDLARMIGQIYHLSEQLLEYVKVPKKQKVL